MRSVEDTSVLVATLLKASGASRARISEATVKRLSNRKRLSTSFVLRLKSWLEADYNIGLFQLERGGFGLLVVRVLDGAPTVTDREWKALISSDIGKLRELAIEWSRQGLDEEDDE